MFPKLTSLKTLTQNYPLLRVFLLEIPIIFGGLELLEFYLKSISLSLHSLNPHPYLAIVLGFALFYGALPGSVAGIIAAILVTHWSLVFELDSMNIVSEMFNAFFLVLGGGIVGAYTSQQTSSLRESQENEQDLASRVVNLEQDRERLVNTNLVLEKKIVSKEDTILTLYEAAQNLVTLNTDEIFDSIPDLLKSYLNAQACSVYVHENHYFQLVAQDGWENEQQFPQRYTSHDPLYQLIAKHHTILTVQELEGIDDAMLVSPLVTKDKQLYGILKIEKIAFLDLTPATIKLFDILRTWIMQSIENARTHGVSQMTQIRDLETGAYSFSFFRERLEREISLSSRYQLDVSVIFVAIDQFSKMEPEVQQKVLSIVYRVAEFQFREDDMIAYIPEAKYQFVILSPLTSVKGAEIGIQRCLNDIIGYEFKPFDNQDDILLLIWDCVSLKDKTLLEHPFVQENFNIQTSKFQSKLEKNNDA